MLLPPFVFFSYLAYRFFGTKAFPLFFIFKKLIFWDWQTYRKIKSEIKEILSLCKKLESRVQGWRSIIPKDIHIYFLWIRESISLHNYDVIITSGKFSRTVVPERRKTKLNTTEKLWQNLRSAYIGGKRERN